MLFEISIPSHAYTLELYAYTCHGRSLSVVVCPYPMLYLQHRRNVAPLRVARHFLHLICRGRSTHQHTCMHVYPTPYAPSIIIHTIDILTLQQ